MMLLTFFSTPGMFWCTLRMRWDPGSVGKSICSKGAHQQQDWI